MTRDAKCFVLHGDCGRIVAAVKYPDPTLSKEIAIFNLYRDQKVEKDAYIILSVSNQVDEIILKDGGLEERGAQRENLRTTRNAFPFIFGNIDLTDALHYLIPSSPVTAYVMGRQKKDHYFQVFNIDDKINENAPGVYMFTILKPNDPEKSEPLSHITFSIISIQKNNVEEIEKAKEKKAKYIWYSHENSELKRQEIISDIKEGENYQYQLKQFSHLME
jgi:hypothetical protein